MPFKPQIVFEQLTFHLKFLATKASNSTIFLGQGGQWGGGAIQQTTQLHYQHKLYWIKL